MRHALFLARQLATEEARVTAFSYAQWWCQQFATSPTTGGGVLATRRSLNFLASQLIRLLPFERNTVFLHTQIYAAPSPYWLEVSDQQEDCRCAWNDYVDVGRGRLAELRVSASWY